MGMALVPRRPTPRLGQMDSLGLEIDPTLLLLGVGVVALAAFLFGESPAHLKRKQRRTKIKGLKAQIRKIKSEE